MTDLTAYYLARLSPSEAILYVQLGGDPRDLPRNMRVGVAKAKDRLADERTGRQSWSEYKQGLKMIKGERTEAA